MMLRCFLIFLALASPGINAGEIPYLRCFELASDRHQVPLALLIGVAKVESHFDADARSAAGAHGIMQVRWPETAKHLGVRRVAELYSPCVNIDVGASYLAELLDRYDNDPQLALAAYNYGPTRLKSRRDIPASVQSYVDKVLAEKTLALQSGQSPAADHGDLVLNSFQSRRLASRYLNAIQALLPQTSIHIDQKGTDLYLIVLEQKQLTYMNQLRLSQLFDLEKRNL